MKCECGTEFEGNFCPSCGRPAIDEAKPSAKPDSGKKTIWDRLEFLTDKRTLLSAGSVLSGLYCVFAGYWITALLFFAGAVLFSPQLRKKHPNKVWLLSIIGSVVLFLGIFAAKFQDALIEVMEEEESYSDSYYYEPTTNEERYGY